MPFGLLTSELLVALHDHVAIQRIEFHQEGSTAGLLGSFVLFQRSPFARRTLLYLVPLAVGALAKAPLVVFAPLLLL